MPTPCRQMEHLGLAIALGLAIGVGALPAALGQQDSTGPVVVKIDEDKTELADSAMPLDPAVRVAYEYVGNMSFGVNGEGRRLTCGAGSAQTNFKIDGQVYHPDVNRAMPGPGGMPLPAGPNKKPRLGMLESWSRGDVHISMILEVVPGKPTEKIAGSVQKRRMDTLLVKYVIENKDAKPHQVGIRMYIDSMCGNNDGAIFASPTTHPGKLLDGVVFKDKEVPDFVEMLENANLANPGFKGVFTLRMGNKIESPNRIVLTSMGAFGEWDVPAIPAMGDSAVAFFWDPQEVRPKSKREVAFAIGQGIAGNPESEGKVSINFGGNFEPNKEFTITAYVEDPIDGQSLTLELPKGMTRTEGKDTQAVPPANDNAQSVVMWKARVLELGTHVVRIRSTNGVTNARTITISRFPSK